MEWLHASAQSNDQNQLARSPGGVLAASCSATDDPAYGSAERTVANVVQPVRIDGVPR